MCGHERHAAPDFALVHRLENVIDLVERVLLDELDRRRLAPKARSAPSSTSGVRLPS